ncbi:MAG: gluconokinase [Roseiflexaceae bacterium]
MATVPPNAAEAPLILTIDAGTSSTRAMLFDRSGCAVAGVAAQEQALVHVSVEGASEQDPAQALALVERCVDAALAQAGPLAGAIGAVAVTTLATTTMALDQAGRPLTGLITYADTRATDDATQLRRVLDERAIHDRTGCLLRASYWPARLAWLRRTQPDLWRAAARWVTLGEWLELHLFGQARASYCAASWSGLLDRRQLAWDAPLLEHLGLEPAALSPLVDRDAPLRGLAAPYAARWPVLRDLPWFPAIGDGAASNIGSGCAGPDRIALNVGTSGALRTVLPEPARVPEGLWCYRLDRSAVLLGGATSEGGNLYAWMQRALRLEDGPALEQGLAALPPDGHGLTLLPFLAGERSPGWAGDVRATISGLSLTTTPVEILRAALESVAYRFAIILELMGGDSQTIVAGGGGVAHSPLWLQIIADALGRPVVASAEPETTSRGTALLALHALGVIPSPAVPAELGCTYDPDPACHRIYQAAIARQRKLYRLLIG